MGVVAGALRAKSKPPSTGLGVLGIKPLAMTCCGSRCAQRERADPYGSALSDEAPGDDLLLHGLGHTTIGACAFHFRVRDGIGWFHTAIVTRERVEGRGSLMRSRHTHIGTWDVAGLDDCRRDRRVQGHLRLYGQAARIISTG